MYNVYVMLYYVIPWFYQGILDVDGWCASLALLSQNLVVNYHLVVSYSQQCHIRLSHRCFIIIAIHITLLFAFSRAEL